MRNVIFCRQAPVSAHEKPMVELINKKEAAKQLGISLATLYNKLNR
ncbi:MAG TPA: hypothetical protein IAA08_06925 [Candidatus Eubacterium avistercoris]|uniref:DNA binding HTH domain-containing protein n=1 Tax=Candidatus Eubacterium avistercoris TaxID=2838567 RepID=A0A9D2D3A3_9FIRM|nr:hypothetical protein [Candidatus Eubacterium avistercoris]